MEPNSLSGPDVHFEHFGGLGPYITRMSVKRRIFSMLGAGPRYCQNDAQDARLKHLGGLAPILLECVSGCSLLSILAAGAKYCQNDHPNRPTARDR